MKKILIVLSLYSGLSEAQDYLRLSHSNTVYDVDVVVFARQLAQPSTATINNASLVNTDEAKLLPDWDYETLLFKSPEINPEADENQSEWQVPLGQDKPQMDALAWINLDRSMDHGIISRLLSNPTIKPLLHNKWRQPATPFLDPQYVRLTSFDVERPPLISHTDETTGLAEVSDNDTSLRDQTSQVGLYSGILETENTLVSDYSVDGQLAFSKQKFTHLHVKLNLYRVNHEGEQIIYKIAQQKRIKLGEWQYFDHQQFGVLAKVTVAEPNIEKTP